MPKRLVHLGQHLMVVLLVLSVSICCCDLHLVGSGIARATHQADAVAASNATVSCCSNCTADGAGDESSPLPDNGGCTTCCIKGSGLKDIGVTLLTGPITVVPYAVPAAPQLFDIPNAPKTALLLAAPRHHVEPPTLLRLRCALIV